MDYREATGILLGEPTMSKIAAAAGVSLNTASRGRMLTSNSRTPPKGWEEIVRRMAQARIDELTSLLQRMADA